MAQRILIAEDHHPLAESLLSLLKGRGFQPEHATLLRGIFDDLLLRRRVGRVKTPHKAHLQLHPGFAHSFDRQVAGCQVLG